MSKDILVYLSTENLLKKTDLHHHFHTKKLTSHFQIVQSTYHHLPVF